MTKAKTFGRQLQQQRLDRQWTLRQFARAQGLDAANLSRIERSLVLPSPPYAWKLLRIYGLGRTARRVAVKTYLAEKARETQALLEE